MLQSEIYLGAIVFLTEMGDAADPGVIVSLEDEQGDIEVYFFTKLCHAEAASETLQKEGEIGVMLEGKKGRDYFGPSDEASQPLDALSLWFVEEEPEEEEEDQQEVDRDAEYTAISQTELNELPDELVAQLSKKKRKGAKHKERVLQIFKDSNEPLHINQVLVNYYKTFNEVADKTYLTKVVYKLVEQGMFEKTAPATFRKVA